MSEFGSSTAPSSVIRLMKSYMPALTPVSVHPRANSKLLSGNPTPEPKAEDSEDASEEEPLDLASPVNSSDLTTLIAT